MNKPLIIVAIVAVSGAGLAGWSLYGQTKLAAKLDDDARSLGSTIQDLQRQAETNTNALDNILLTYKNEQLGIEFDYPASWGSVSFTMMPGGGESGAGFKYGGRFSGQEDVIFGGRSRDFREDRGAGFTDFRGNRDEVDRSRIPTLTILTSGGYEAAMYFNQEISMILGADDRAARVFLRGPDFYGIAFVYQQILPDEVARFDAMIRSIRPINQ